MFSFFKKKKIIPHIKQNGVIGNVGKLKQVLQVHSCGLCQESVDPKITLDKFST